MAKKTKEPASLGEVVAGRGRGSLDGMKRLASAHPGVRYIVDVVERLKARPYATNVLISGEPGTGKEGLAHTIHDLMHPDGAPLVSIATGGRSDEEFAAELFGTAPRAKGERPTPGAVEMAEGGTLVIDDIAWLSPNLQWRLLDLLRRGAYTRGGETRVRQAQLHVIAITDEDLPKSVTAGRFRHDLLHKLARIHLVLPPLRQRPEDIPAAVEWMAKRVLMLRGLSTAVALEGSTTQNLTADGSNWKEGVIIRKDAIEALRSHGWPGNFRELEVVVERALMLFGDGNQLTRADVQAALANPSG
jgi:DNA-binding NtrC family response regulator